MHSLGVLAPLVKTEYDEAFSLFHPFPFSLPFPYLYKTVCFYTYAHNSRGSPDMILTTVYVKFNDEKMRYLSGPVDPKNRIFESQTCRKGQEGRKGLQALGRICRQNHVWGPPGARIMSLCIKTYSFVKVGKKRREKGKGCNQEHASSYAVFTKGANTPSECTGRYEIRPSSLLFDTKHST